jgi:hypothetical protein
MISIKVYLCKHHQIHKLQIHILSMHSEYVKNIIVKFYR